MIKIIIASIVILNLTGCVKESKNLKDNNYSSNPELIIDGRYIDNKDGTVTDIETNLVWKRCSEGQNWNGNNCSGNPLTYKWDEAVQVQNTYPDKNWRLPTVAELNTIVFCSNGKNRKFDKFGLNDKYDTRSEEGFRGCGSDKRGWFQKPTINLNAFPDAQKGRFWSISLKSLAGNFAVIDDNGFRSKFFDYSKSKHAWYVDFTLGEDTWAERNKYQYVRLVKNK